MPLARHPRAVIAGGSVGGLFVGHGTQKLFGWFGGSGLETTAAGFEHLGLRPAKANAIAERVLGT